VSTDTGVGPFTEVPVPVIVTICGLLAAMNSGAVPGFVSVIVLMTLCVPTACGPYANDKGLNDTLGAPAGGAGGVTPPPPPPPWEARA
jgi:hypothetical protein